MHLPSLTPGPASTGDQVLPLCLLLQDPTMSNTVRSEALFDALNTVSSTVAAQANALSPAARAALFATLFPTGLTAVTTPGATHKQQPGTIDMKPLFMSV